MSIIDWIVDLIYQLCNTSWFIACVVVISVFGLISILRCLVTGRFSRP